VADFASFRADEGRKLSTIRREVAAVARFHRLKGFNPPPTDTEGVRETLSGIARAIGSRVDQAPPVMRDDLRNLAETFDDSLRGLRDRAVLLLGWLTVCRRSELIALNIEDFTINPDGAEVLIRRSKNDQEGRGLVKVCHYATREPGMCAVLAVQKWLRVSGIESGPLFPTIRNSGKVGRGRMNGETVARIVQRAAAGADIQDRQFSAHSLRSGGISQMAADGVPLSEIQKHSGHKSLQVLMSYIRRAQRWDGKSATAGLL
jgi:integrase